MSRNDTDLPSISDLIRDCQYESNNFHLAQLMDNCDWLCNTSALWSSNYSGDEIKRIKEEEYDEDSNDSPVSIQEPPVSWFKEAKRRQRPWLKSFVNSNYLLSRIACVANTKYTKIYIYTHIYKRIYSR